MQCENNLCIYQKGNTCILEEIALDAVGMCEDCIIVPIDTDFLEAEKQKHLLNREQQLSAAYAAATCQKPT